MSAKDSGRVSPAALVCAKAGARTHLLCRLLRHHPGRRTEPKGFQEADFAAFLDAAHQQLGGNLVLLWDNSTQHTDTAMRALLAKREAWLTVYQLPPYCPDMNPAEGVWANLKESLANLAACGVDALADKCRTRLKRMQYRPDLLDGFIAETGLMPAPP